MGSMLKWRPSWWSESVHGSAWERVREAMRRDWMQTKHDLGLGGHELNQSVDNTVLQAVAKQHLPNINQANPPTIIGEWDEAEVPYGYGYGAHMRYGDQYPVWSDALEQDLAREWRATGHGARYEWETFAPSFAVGTSTTRRRARGRPCPPRASRRTRRTPNPARANSPSGAVTACVAPRARTGATHRVDRRPRRGS